MPWSEAESELFLNEYKTERNFHTAAQRTGTKNASVRALYLLLIIANLFDANGKQQSTSRFTGADRRCSSHLLTLTRRNARHGTCSCVD